MCMCICAVGVYAACVCVCARSGHMRVSKVGGAWGREAGPSPGSVLTDSAGTEALRKLLLALLPGCILAAPADSPCGGQPAGELCWTRLLWASTGAPAAPSIL